MLKSLSLSVQFQLQSLTFFKIEEILVAVDLQLAAGRLIAGDDGVFMHLQGTAGNLGADRSLNSCCKSSSLVVAVDDKQDFPCIRDSRDTDRKSLLSRESCSHRCRRNGS